MHTYLSREPIFVREAVLKVIDGLIWFKRVGDWQNNTIQPSHSHALMEYWHRNDNEADKRFPSSQLCRNSASESGTQLIYSACPMKLTMSPPPWYWISITWRIVRLAWFIKCIIVATTNGRNAYNMYGAESRNRQQTKINSNGLYVRSIGNQVVTRKRGCRDRASGK